MFNSKPILLFLFLAFITFESSFAQKVKFRKDFVYVNGEKYVKLTDCKTKNKTKTCFITSLEGEKLIEYRELSVENPNKTLNTSYDSGMFESLPEGTSEADLKITYLKFQDFDLETEYQVEGQKEKWYLNIEYFLFREMYNFNLIDDRGKINEEAAYLFTEKQSKIRQEKVKKMLTEYEKAESVGW